MSRGPAECRRAQSQEKNRNLAQAGPRCWRGDLVSHWSSCGRELRQLVNTERLFQLRNLLYRAFKAGAPQQLVLPLLELIPQSVKLFLGEQGMECREEDRILSRLVRSIHPDKLLRWPDESLRLRSALERGCGRVE